MSWYTKLPQIAEEESSAPAGPSSSSSSQEEASSAHQRGSGGSSVVEDFGNEDHRAIFWSREQGIYFAYKWREWKIMACRAMLKVVSIFVIFLFYAAMWNVCDLCIMYTMFGACGVTLLGGNFLFSSCWIGILATFLRGFRIGSTDAHVDVKWTI